MDLFCTISNDKWQFLSKIAAGGSPWNFVMAVGLKKQNQSDMCIHLDTIPTLYGQMDGQKDRNSRILHSTC